MKRTMTVTIFFLLGVMGTMYAQNSHGGEAEVKRVRQYLSGRQLELSYRKGGPLYGTTWVENVHLCPSGKYFSSGYGERMTVMDNRQTYNSEDYGTWEVVSFQGQVHFGSRSYSTGEASYIPIRILSDGRIRVDADATLRIIGRAQCR